MSSSSLFFGGINFWNGRSSPSDNLPPLSSSLLEESASQFNRFFDWHQWFFFRFISYIQSIESGTYAWFFSTLCLLILLAYSTTPSDSSFHSYLTELSLHQHLRQLQKENSTSQARLSGDELEGITRSEAEKKTTPHVLTFANRISITLRTPRYIRRDYGIFCTVDIPQGHKSERGRSAKPLTCTRYIGMFGKWRFSGVVTLHQKQSVKSGKLAAGQSKDIWGVLCMRSDYATDDEDNHLISDSPNHEKQKSINAKDTGKSSTGERNADRSYSRSLARRKKQTQKSRPSQPILAGETSAADRRPSDEIVLQQASAVKSGQESAEKGFNPECNSSPSSKSFLEEGELNGNAAAIVEYQAQLEQIRITSETSRKQLQAQLEEMRMRKRDEDAARLDVKSKVKTLDESKRHAEGIKREAERRLKVANGVREAIENRIEARSNEIEMLKSQKLLHESKVIGSSEKRVTRVLEIQVETQSKEKEKIAADAELIQLKEKLEHLQARLLEEEANLEAAHDLAVERDHAATISGPQEHMPNNGGYANVYPLLSGAGEVPDSSTNESFYSDWSSNDKYQPPFSFQSPPPPPSARMSDAHERLKGNFDSDDTFDPTLGAESNRQYKTKPSFAPFSFNQSALNSQQTLSDRNEIEVGASIPPTPFTANLLPSNLFQNADDDERHEGVLPGSRTERVEAALNRFGLDSSDSSDLGGAGEEGDEQSENDNGKEEVRGGPVRRLSRSWWGARGRNSSKDRTSSVGNILALTDAKRVEDRIPLALSSSDAILDALSSQPEIAKKKSSSIFPKLSLNPGAKSFRGTSKKNDGENSPFNSSSGLGGANSYDSGLMQSMWNNSTGQLPNGQDFESVKRAFQTNNLHAAQEDEEQGRKSWSAFDTWQQQQGNLPTLTAVNAGIDRQQNARYPSRFSTFTNPRASSDSIAQRRAFLASQTNTLSSSPANQIGDWLDDAILPLHKTQSNDGNSSSVSSTSLPRNSRSGKASRFAFWNSGNSSNNNNAGNEVEKEVGQEPSLASHQEIYGEESNASGKASPDPASMSISGTHQPSKRNAFRWSRRQEIPSADASISSDKSSV